MPGRHGILRAGSPESFAGSGSLVPPSGRLRKVRNLIDNAIKYGGRARVTLEDTPQELVVSIEDGGPGIPEAERERVFDPFYRIEGAAAARRAAQGWG